MGESIIFDFGSIAEKLPKEEKKVIITPKPTIFPPAVGVDPFHPLVFLEISALRMLVIKNMSHGCLRPVHPDDFRNLGFRTVHFNGSTFEVR